MCIIAYVPSGETLTDDCISTMFDNNPDGAGLMWKARRGCDIQIRKGFMTAEDLLNAWHQIPTKYERAIHCRIATSGKVGTATCHPFPIRKNINMLGATSTSCDMGLMHNGVICSCTPKGGMKSKYSDTMVYVSKVIYPLKSFLNNEHILAQLQKGCDGSRVLIMRKNGKTIRYGTWVYNEGCFFSNGTYKPFVPVVVPTKAYGAYGWGQRSCGICGIRSDYDDCGYYYTPADNSDHSTTDDECDEELFAAYYQG